MMYNTANKSESSNLRQKAAGLLDMKPTSLRSRFFEVDTLKLIHELELQQIELRLQNEELLLERSIALDASKKYKKACEKFTELYDFAPSGYFTLSKGGEIIELNLAGAKKLGKVRSRLISRLFGFYVTDDTKPIFDRFLTKVFNSKAKETCKVTLSKDDNIPMYVYLIGIANENGEQCRINVVDITEFKQEEQDLIIAKEKSEENDRLKSAFLANMSHEIRTPMNGIMGFTELLKKPDLSVEKQRKYISMIEKGGVHLLNIINDLIDISKIESGQTNVNISTCNVNEQIKYIYTFFTPEVEGKGMQLFFQNTLPAIDSVIETDCEKLLAILTNLIKNAIKYSDKGTIDFGYKLKPVGVSAGLVNKPSVLEFFVKDTGIGIPQDKMDVVFDRFVQAHMGGTRACKGAGLGLAISKAYVEMLGGKMWAESEVGKGSTFYFTIPYNRKTE